MEQPKKAIEFMYKNQGYVDVNLASQMSGTPNMFVENWLNQNGFKESGIKGQYIKSRP